MKIGRGKDIMNTLMYLNIGTPKKFGSILLLFPTFEWMKDLRFYILFNSISVISG